MSRRRLSSTRCERDSVTEDPTRDRRTHTASAFSAISAFHFGNENFLVTQPFLNRYRDVLPFIGLQDDDVDHIGVGIAFLGAHLEHFIQIGQR